MDVNLLFVRYFCGMGWVGVVLCQTWDLFFAYNPLLVLLHSAFLLQTHRILREGQESYKLPVESHNPFHSNEKSGPKLMSVTYYFCSFRFLFVWLNNWISLSCIWFTQLIQVDSLGNGFRPFRLFLIECKGWTVAFLMFLNLLISSHLNKKLNGQTFFFYYKDKKSL